ncbi:MAG: hypothetical protein EZS28_020881 [Streblomastix strix]|uniref:DUF4371 domain-containing protein n=1 Tax=Streblomastix strix TaxID=222440 RepID=A0A5J4VMD3_9EUKA|nr:MAG: hypothetical protein EZS28_020881 [Streblomastix strix]
MVEESIDITSLNEMIIFATYVTNDGVIHSVFIDIIPLDEKGATGQNIYDKFKRTFANNRFNIKHICSACVDGAAAMIDYDSEYGVQQIKDIYKQFKDFFGSSEIQVIDERKLAKEYLNEILKGVNVKQVCEFAVEDELFNQLEIAGLKEDFLA